MSAVAICPDSATRLNAGLCGLLVARNLLLFFVVPAWLLPASRWWALLLVPVALTTNTMLHFNLHGVHHRHPHLPWFALPAQFERDGGRPDIDLATCFLRQLRGPIPLDHLPS